MAAAISSRCPRMLLVLLIVGLSGCDGPLSSDPHADLTGRYVLRLHKGWPLPYFDLRTQEVRVSGTLELKRGGRYEQIDDRAGLGELVIVGEFFPRGDRIALVSDEGMVESFSHEDGILISEGAVYIREGRDIPREYRWKRYDLLTCDGVSPSYMTPCPGTSISSSRIWLRDNGRYDLAETGVGATSRWQSMYGLNGEQILMQNMPEDRYVGTLRSDTLTLGTWIYHRID